MDLVPLACEDEFAQEFCIIGFTQPCMEQSGLTTLGLQRGVLYDRVHTDMNGTKWTYYPWLAKRSFV